MKLLKLLLIFGFPIASLAQPPQTEVVEAQLPPELEFRGFLSTSYSLNLANPDSGRNGLRGYDFADRKLKLDGLNLDVRYGLDSPSQLGFRLDMVGGASYPPIDAATGLFRSAQNGQTNTAFDIRQAFVRYTFDNQLQIDAGKFATIFGYEVMPGVDGANPHGTVAYSYVYNPYTHTGLRMSYPINDELSVTGLAVLGADNFQDTNRAISLAGQVNWRPDPDFSIAVNAMVGPEQAGDTRSTRRLVDLVANYQVAPEVNLGLHAFHRQEQRLGGTGRANGIVGYLQSELADGFWLNFRQEFVRDGAGIFFGQPVTVRSFTVSPEYRVTPDWAFRIDFRFEKASQDVFLSRGRPSNYQNTIFFNQYLNF